MATKKQSGITDKPASLQPGVYLTESGIVSLKKELSKLKDEKLQEVTQRIVSAREISNTEENSEYDAALDEQEVVTRRIAELQNILKHVTIIHDEPSSEFVVIGSKVKIEMDGSLDEFTIVGRVEANPAKKRISNESPLGSALLGAKIGEAVDVATPMVRYTCKILEIK